VLRSDDAEQLPSMTTKPSSTAFTYIDCDVPAEQTLVEWRRERDAVRQAQRRPRRLRRLAREQWARWTA
jgi:hypothetical protein